MLCYCVYLCVCAMIRFLVKDLGKWTRVVMKPLEGDPDMYIVNSRDGLLAATKDNYVWRSVSVGCACVDILPTDRNATRGGHFVVGVFGNREVNEFQLTITNEAAPSIIDINKNNRFDFNLTASHSYFRLQVNPAEPESISLCVALADNRHFKSNLSEDAGGEKLGTISAIDRSIGRGIYCNSSIAALPSGSSWLTADTGLGLPVPVMYLSTTCAFPSEEFHSWKVNSADRKNQFCFLISVCVVRRLPGTTALHGHSSKQKK